MGLCRGRNHIRETNGSRRYAFSIPFSLFLCDVLTSTQAQLQKFEDSAPEALEFERLKEHFEPFLRASSSSAVPTPSHTHHTYTNPITAAASSALARDIPGVAKYTPHPSTLMRSRSGRDKAAGRHDIPD